MDLDTALKQISAALVKMWSIHVDDLIAVLFVTTLEGCVTMCAGSQEASSGSECFNKINVT